ncbi:hypothetical protein BaRGS_00028650, partial [Batillaria attramentaria]
MAAAPFVVGRPDQSTDPFSSPFSSPGVGLRHRDYGLRRARTTLSTEITPAHTAVTNAREAATSSIGAWPRVVVRDVTGRTLDTFTTLQDAIYRASWTVKTRHEWPVTPLEWRLPKAPVPSKPDFSRAGTLPRAVTSYSLHLGRSYRTEVQSAPVRPVLTKPQCALRALGSSNQRGQLLPAGCDVTSLYRADQIQYMAVLVVKVVKLYLLHA